MKKIIPNILHSFNNDALIFAHVVFRHGERNVDKFYPNDPNKDESNWPEGVSQLTNEGKRQAFRLGQYFRRRYDKVIGQKYSPNKIYIQSTDFDRTIMSAQACLAGLYPPTDEEKWHDEIMWQPIPVHTIPLRIDRNLSLGKYFPEYDTAIQSFMKQCPEVQRIYTEYESLFKHWTQMSGTSITTIYDVYSLHKTLVIERERNMKLPDWAEEAIQPNGTMEYIASYIFKLGSASPRLSKLKSGYLLKEMIQRFEQKINSTLQPDRSLWLLSGHDFTISNLLESLGMFELHIPPYAASLHFELFKPDGNEHYFQIFYRKSNDEHPVPMEIPGVGEKCSLKQFYDLYKEILPDDLDANVQ